MYVWYWISIGNCDSIQHTIIATGMPISGGFLGYHMQGPKRLRRDVRCLIVACVRTLVSPPSGILWASGYWWACCFDVMCDIMQEQTVRGIDLGKEWKLGQQFVVGVTSVRGSYCVARRGVVYDDSLDAQLRSGV